MGKVTNYISLSLSEIVNPNVQIRSQRVVHLVAVQFGWLRGSVVEGRSSAGVLSLSCARPVADG